MSGNRDEIPPRYQDESAAARRERQQDQTYREQVQESRERARQRAQDSADTNGGGGNGGPIGSDPTGNGGTDGGSSSDGTNGGASPAPDPSGGERSPGAFPSDVPEGSVDPRYLPDQEQDRQQDQTYREQVEEARERARQRARDSADVNGGVMNGDGGNGGPIGGPPEPPTAPAPPTDAPDEALDLRGEVAGQYEYVDPSQVSVETTDSGYRAFVPDSVQRYAARRSVAEQSDLFGYGDVEVEETDEGFRGFVPADVRRETLAVDLTEGTPFGPSQVEFTETDEGIRGVVPEDVRRDELRRQAALETEGALPWDFEAVEGSEGLEARLTTEAQLDLTQDRVAEQLGVPESDVSVEERPTDSGTQVAVSVAGDVDLSGLDVSGSAAAPVPQGDPTSRDTPQLRRSIGAGASVAAGPDSLGRTTDPTPPDPQGAIDPVDLGVDAYQGADAIAEEIYDIGRGDTRSSAAGVPVAAPLAAGVATPEPATTAAGLAGLGVVAAGSAVYEAQAGRESDEIALPEEPGVATDELPAPATPQEATFGRPEVGIPDPQEASNLGVPEQGAEIGVGEGQNVRDVPEIAVTEETDAGVTPTELPLSGGGETATETGTGTGGGVVPDSYPQAGRDFPADPSREYVPGSLETGTAVGVGSGVGAGIGEAPSPTIDRQEQIQQPEVVEDAGRGVAVDRSSFNFPGDAPGGASLQDPNREFLGLSQAALATGIQPDLETDPASGIQQQPAAGEGVAPGLLSGLDTAALPASSPGVGVGTFPEIGAGSGAMTASVTDAATATSTTTTTMQEFVTPTATGTAQGFGFGVGFGYRTPEGGTPRRPPFPSESDERPFWEQFGETDATSESWYNPIAALGDWGQGGR